MNNSLFNPPTQDGQSIQEQQALAAARYMQAFTDSCPGKVVISGTMGFFLGGAFGLFMSSMSYDTPFHTPSTSPQPITTLPWRAQLRHGFADIGQRTYSSAKNFGKVGALFSGTECAIEAYRAKNDMVNGVAAGCVTGGILAMGAGPQAAAVGCVGFAAFSAAIDAYMRRSGEGD